MYHYDDEGKLISIDVNGVEGCTLAYNEEGNIIKIDITSDRVWTKKLSDYVLKRCGLDLEVLRSDNSHIRAHKGTWNFEY